MAWNRDTNPGNYHNWYYYHQHGNPQHFSQPSGGSRTFHLNRSVQLSYVNNPSEGQYRVRNQYIDNQIYLNNRSGFGRQPYHALFANPDSTTTSQTVKSPKVKGMANAKDVRLVRLPFLEVVDTLLKVGVKISNKEADTLFRFSIPGNYAKQIVHERGRTKLQVIVRFCKFELDQDQGDHLPATLYLRVNKRMCQIPALQVVPRGPPAQIDITSLCNLQYPGNNELMVTTSERLVMVVQLVKTRNAQELLQYLTLKNPLKPEETEAKIRRQLEGGQGGEITSSTLTCSLLCPLGKVKMKLPCRSSSCHHFQCFDAQIFLQMNEMKPKWKCPVCSGPALYDTLQIDGYFKNVVEQSNDISKVELQADGTWKPLTTEKGVKSSTEAALEESCEGEATGAAALHKTVVLDSDEEEGNPTVPQPAQPSLPGKQRKSVETICLSDSDDEQNESAFLTNSHPSNPAQLGLRSSHRLFLHNTPQPAVRSSQRSVWHSTPQPAVRSSQRSVWHSTPQSVAGNTPQPQLRRSSRSKVSVSDRTKESPDDGSESDDETEEEEEEEVAESDDSSDSLYEPSRLNKSSFVIDTAPAGSQACATPGRRMVLRSQRKK